jgi:protein tyrosine phosphatase (PTP) superfamily phosphohydrolase (DUF442 family)
LAEGLLGVLGRQAHKARWLLVVVAILAASWGFLCSWKVTAEKRVHCVVPRRLIRGAWQHPRALRAIIEREGIKTIVTLTAINRDDPKYVKQARVVAETGVSWVLVPMRGSQATLEQMACAADLLADPARQPVYFHCVAGHHRTSLVHAAYLIRHEGRSAQQAWEEVARLPWSRPSAAADQNDRRLIERFARVHRFLSPSPEAEDHATCDWISSPSRVALGDGGLSGTGSAGRRVLGVRSGDLQLRHR